MFGIPSFASLKDHPEKAHLFPQLTIDRSYPPTYFLHGKDDQAVPFTESVQFEEVLRKAGVQTQITVVDGMDHFLDQEEVPIIQEERRKILEFLTKRIERGLDTCNTGA